MLRHVGPVHNATGEPSNAVAHNPANERISMNAESWAVITATLLGPILAVQAQKAIERASAARQRREWVFLNLMATRQDRISLDHVKALNSIDLAFYGRRVLGRVWRGGKAQAVIDAWNEYRKHLTPADDMRKRAAGDVNAWSASGNELL